MANLIPEKAYNLSTTSGSYEGNKYYDNNILRSPYFPYYYDEWKNNKNYGVIYNNTILYPKHTSLRNYMSDNGSQQKNIFFVVDAFLDMKKYIKNLLTTKIIDSTSILTSMNVESSTDDAEKIYLEHVNTLLRNFIKEFIPRFMKEDVTNINIFVKYFLKYLEIMTAEYKFTRQSFISSNRMPNSINGLTISFLNKSSEDIYFKANKIAASDDFQLFYDIIGRFGFFVDRNSPWKIVADLNSPTMKKYYYRYNIKNINDIFEKYYFKPYKHDILTLKNLFINFWNSYVSQKNIVLNNKNYPNKCQKFTAELTTLTPINEKIFDYYFNINWQLRLYIYIRILEEKTKFSQQKFEQLHEESCKINTIYDLEKSILHINNIIMNSSQPKNLSLASSLTEQDPLVKVINNTYVNIPLTKLNF